jgi:hypothetical protein
VYQNTQISSGQLLLKLTFIFSRMGALSWLMLTIPLCRSRSLQIISGINHSERLGLDFSCFLFSFSKHTFSPLDGCKIQRHRVGWEQRVII